MGGENQGLLEEADDLAVPLQVTELVDLQRQKRIARTSVAEVENAVITSCLLMIAFDLVRKIFANSFLCGNGAQVYALYHRRLQ